MIPIAFFPFRIVTISVLFLFLSIETFAQTTYKVVCDKTDNTVKVVESSNRSPNYVPIKGGFPFRPIAQKWIDENYATTICNPGEIIEQNKKQQNTPTQTNNNTQPTPSPTSPPAPTPPQKQLQPRQTEYNTAPPYKNSSFIINAKFSDLGKLYSLDNNLAPGFNVGLEQLIGGKMYVGVGVNMNFYFVDFSTNYNLDEMTFFFGKIPLFVGYRIYHNKRFVMSEFGVEVNTAFRSSDDDFNFFGSTPTSNSFDLTARVRYGSGKFMVTLGSEVWVSEIIENDEYRMSVIYLGMKFSF